MPFNKDAAVSYLTRAAGTESGGKCARYVRLAIQAGGITIEPPGSRKAKDYGPALKDGGFTALPANITLYKKGDVVVIDGYPGNDYGHMAMFDGKGWVSDFVQNPGIYPGPGYRKAKPNYTVYRFPDPE